MIQGKELVRNLLSPQRPLGPKKPFLRALVFALSGLVLFGTVFAAAEPVSKGNLLITVSGRLSPRALPRRGSAPVSVSIGGRITTTDQTEPPQLRELAIEINSHGRIDAAGLPTCNASAIRTASSGRALGACGSALVGEGKFVGTITLPGAAPYPLEGKLLVFNAREHGHQVLLGHVYSPHPFATSFLIPFSIKRGAKGSYGTLLIANLKQALGARKNLTGIQMTLFRRYSVAGERRSYVSAGCPAPKGVNLVSFPLARTTFSFADGAKLTSVLTRACRARN